MGQIQTVAIGALVLSSIAGTAFGQCSESAQKATDSHITNVSYRAPADTKDIVDTAVAAGSFKTLAAALNAAGLVDTLKGKGPFTVFAPTDEAFAKLPKGTVENLLKPENKALLTSILTFHVVSGNVTADKVVKLNAADTVNGQRVSIAVKDGKVSLEGQSTVTATDIKATNGVIHVIDTVLMPASKNIIATATEASSFTTLLAAIDAAGLKSALEGDGPFTVFAPSDAAFAKLPAGTVENLLKPENKNQLVSILKLHVISGRVFADQVVKMKESSKTLQGSTFNIKVKDGKVTIGNSKAMAGVVATDIESSNGVIHVIDTVLMPN